MKYPEAELPAVKGEPARKTAVTSRSHPNLTSNRSCSSVGALLDGRSSLHLESDGAPKTRHLHTIPSMTRSCASPFRCGSFQSYSCRQRLALMYHFCSQARTLGESFTTLLAVWPLAFLRCSVAATHPQGTTKPSYAQRPACNSREVPAAARVPGGGKCLADTHFASADAVTTASARGSTGGFCAVWQENLITPHTASVGVLLQKDPMDPVATQRHEVPLQVTPSPACIGQVSQGAAALPCISKGALRDCSKLKADSLLAHRRCRTGARCGSSRRHGMSCFANVRWRRRRQSRAGSRSAHRCLRADSEVRPSYIRNLKCPTNLGHSAGAGGGAQASAGGAGPVGRLGGTASSLQGASCQGIACSRDMMPIQ